MAALDELLHRPGAPAALITDYTDAMAAMQAAFTERDVAYAALGTAANIRYIDMPEAIRGSYQYFTQGDVDRLQRAGYNGGFTALEDSVATYVRGYLDSADRFR